MSVYIVSRHINTTIPLENLSTVLYAHVMGGVLVVYLFWWKINNPLLYSRVGDFRPADPRETKMN